MKATNAKVTRSFLSERAGKAIAQGYPKQKWVTFCEAMLDAGYTLHLYEARRTFSKYITISRGKARFKVRFSNHRPIVAREANKDCDFFVGVTNFGITTTDQAIAAVHTFFGGKHEAQAANLPAM